ncbi:hypothetical protein K439DRAFT_1288702, partial [Ramaria rubella]
FYTAALDYLPIQVTSIPSELLFSSSSETDTKHCNHIKPELQEAHQMLKFYFKQSRLDFTGGWMTTEVQI